MLSPSTRVAGLLITLQLARALAVSLPHDLSAPAIAAGLRSSLWSDLLINTAVVARRRRAGRGRAEYGPDVAPARPVGPVRPPWWLVLRAYERLWDLPPGTLWPPHPPRAPAARLAPELVDWLRTDPRSDATSWLRPYDLRRCPSPARSASG